MRRLLLAPWILLLSVAPCAAAENVDVRRGVPDDVIAEAEAAGATIGRTGTGTFWGGYSGVFIDPEGHPWEVAHNPFWSVTEDGQTIVGEGGKG